MGYALAVTIWVRPGEGEQVAQLMRLNEAGSRQEPGCVAFIAHHSTEDPDRFLLYEQFVDEAAYHAHHETEHFKRYAEAMEPLRVETKVHLYTTIDEAQGESDGGGG